LPGASRSFRIWAASPRNAQVRHFFPDTTYDISDITVTGNDALVSGDFTFTFDDGDAPHAADETWPEPDLNDQTPGIGWLHKTADGWRVIGDQCTQR
jgi:hypothetical protein